MIVKVQAALTTSPMFKEERYVLIYDEDKASLLVQEPISVFIGLAEAMGDRDRAFFECDVIEHLDPGCQRIHEATVLHRRDCECSKQIIFGRMLPEQGW